MNYIKHFLFLFLTQLFISNNALAQLGGTVMALEGLSDVQQIVNTSEEIISTIDVTINTVKNSGAYKTVVDGKSLTLPYGSPKKKYFKVDEVLHSGGFKLYRAKDKDDLTTYEFIAGNTREFYDKQLRPNTTYTYLLVAELRGGYPSGYSEKIVIKY